MKPPAPLSPSQEISDARTYKGQELRSNTFQSASVTDRYDLENVGFMQDLNKQHTDDVVQKTTKDMFDLSLIDGEVDEELIREREQFYNQYLYKQALILGHMPQLEKAIRIAEITPEEVQFVDTSLGKLGNALRRMKVELVEPFVIDFPPIN